MNSKVLEKGLGGINTFSSSPSSVTSHAGAFYGLNSTGNQRRRALVDAVCYRSAFWCTDQGAGKGPQN